MKNVKFWQFELEG